MNPATILKVLAGAGAGAAVGFLMSKARVCSAQACGVKMNMVFSMIAWAVFGAAVAWYFMSR